MFCKYLIFICLLIFYFWDYNITVTFSFLPFLSSLHILHTAFHSASNLWHLFSITVWHAYISLSISMIMYMYILKYNLLSSYSIICMCVFKVDLSTVDNQSVCYCMINTTSHIPSFPRLPVVLFAVLRLEFCLSVSCSGLGQVTT